MRIDKETTPSFAREVIHLQRSFNRLQDGQILLDRIQIVTLLQR